jgi:hypothetical protein
MAGIAEYRAMISSKLYDFLGILKAESCGDGQWKAPCPCHDDTNPSLSVGIGDNGKILIHCHANCPIEKIVAAAGFTMSDLFPESRPRRERWTKGTLQTGGFATAADAIACYEKKDGPHNKTWPYHNAAGDIVGYTVRWNATSEREKIIKPIALAADGRWSLCAMPSPRPLLNRSDVAKSDCATVVEGETCADAAASLGLTATTSAGGSKAANHSDWSPLAGKHLVLWPDPDESGQRYINDIRRHLSRCNPPPKSIRIFDPKADAADWIAAGGTREQFDKAVASLPDVGTSNAPADEPIELLPFVDVVDFLAKEYPIEYIVEGVLVKDQNCVVGGPEKSHKTTVGAIDLGISIVTGCPFLGKFPVLRKMRVGIISGESGEGTIKETVERIAKSRSVTFSPSELFICNKLPDLASDIGLQQLAETLSEFKTEVVIIDPLYLCLPSKQVHSGDLYGMGPLFARIGETCKACGTTPILLHHFAKGARYRKNEFAQPDISDLSQAGVAEWCRQHILFGPRSRYRGDGNHKLHLIIGGSAGHSSQWALDIDEGVRRKTGDQRHYKVTLESAADESDRKKQEAEANREAKSEKDRESKIKKIIAFLKKYPDGRTFDNINNRIPGAKEKVRDLLTEAVERGLIATCELETRCGKGNGRRVVEGWRLIPLIDATQASEHPEHPEHPEEFTLSSGSLDAA